MLTNSLELTASTLDIAKREGLLRLGLEESQVTIEVMQEPSKGFLGLGKKEAKIRMTAKVSTDATSTSTATSAPTDSPVTTASTPHLSDSDASASLSAERAQAIETASKIAVDFLMEMTAAMGVQAHVVVSSVGKNLNIDISGDNMGVLIGKRGITIEAIQSIVNLVVNKGEHAYVNVLIDIENYRDRRRENLQRLAQNLARRVKTTGRSVTLEPMTSGERRIIHYALEKDKSVYTKSRGTEPYRYIVIEPSAELRTYSKPSYNKPPYYSKSSPSKAEYNKTFDRETYTYGDIVGYDDGDDDDDL